MKLSKCKSCHHEWQGERLTCDWCGSLGMVIEEAAPMNIVEAAARLCERLKTGVA